MAGRGHVDADSSRRYAVLRWIGSAAISEQKGRTRRARARKGADYKSLRIPFEESAARVRVRLRSTDSKKI